MILTIPNWKPVQQLLPLFYDVSYDCEITEIRTCDGKKNRFLFIAIKILNGDFAGQSIYRRMLLDSALSMSFFSALGISTSSSISVETDEIIGREVTVNVFRRNSRMYDEVCGFRPVFSNKQGE